MTEVNFPSYCEQCGELAQEGDRFCGNCGATVTPVTPEDPQVIPRPAATAQDSTATRNKRTLLMACAVGVLLLLVVGGGSLTLAGVGPGVNLLGGADSEAVGNQETTSPSGTTRELSPTEPDRDTQEGGQTSVAPDASPDSAFESLLPTLQGTTIVPLMLPAKLPEDLDMVAIDGLMDDSDQEYGIVFTYGPTELIATPSNAQTLGNLRAYPEDEDQSNEYFDAESVERVILPDGTEATLRRMVPSGRSGSQGPFWEGKFDKGGYTYKLMVTKPNEISKDEVKQALSTMVLVPGSGGDPINEGSTSPTTTPYGESESTISSSGDLEAEAEEAAGEYYRAAGVEDWSYTYEHLDSETQSMFTEEEWFQKNQYYWDWNPAVYDILSADSVADSDIPYTEIRVRITGEDGSSSVRTTYWVQQNGEWKHRFSQEEVDSFKPELSFEEFVEAQQ